MQNSVREKGLKIVLVAGGLASLGLYPLGLIWPSGWLWGEGMGAAHSPYFLMLCALYATLGVFLFLAARNPQGYGSLIWFTVWSSLAHAAVMAVQALMDPAEAGHLVGDVPALVILAAALAVFAPRGYSTQPESRDHPTVTVDPTRG